VNSTKGTVDCGTVALSHHAVHNNLVLDCIGFDPIHGVCCRAGLATGAVLGKDGFNPGATDTSFTHALGIADGVRRSSTASVPGPAAWPPSPTVWTEGGNSMRGPISTRVSTRAAATGVVPAPTTGVVALQHPFVDTIFYKGTGVQ
jgi:hypothetical protein